MNEKIQTTHLQRKAYVYLRQSTMRQVVEHRESTQRQYGLRDRAIVLEWPESLVQVIDEDLGRSASSTEGRDGFQKLCEKIVQGTVGAILSLEVSRLARRSSDWHRLLDLCGVADVLIVDEQSVYDPSEPNDRLMLGIKGTMSEAELGWMQLRLRGARLSKARRGELRLSSPVGYLWDRASCRLRLDPDVQVQGALALIFHRFRIDRSAGGVARYFCDNRLRIPGRDKRTDVIAWNAPRPSRILQILHNPTYAGVYLYGRRMRHRRIVNGEIVNTYQKRLREDWKVVVFDRHPALLSWDDFLQNQSMLTNNLNGWPLRSGAARRGSALLQGITICGRCGHKMHTAYRGRSGLPSYCCDSPVRGGQSSSRCWSVAAREVDAAIANIFLQAIEPAQLDLAMQMSVHLERESRSLRDHWDQRLQRFEYEAALARRRYQAVDPDNRVVAKTLEAEWEDSLRSLEEEKRKHEQAVRRTHKALSDDERRQVFALSRDLPRLWSAESTSAADRKKLLRILVQYVTLTPGIRGAVTMQILWQTGVVSRHDVGAALPGNRPKPAAIALLSSLVQNASAPQRWPKG